MRIQPKSAMRLSARRKCSAAVLRFITSNPLRGFGVGEQRQKTPPKTSGRQRPHSWRTPGFRLFRCSRRASTS
jgi:hypothetical protein